MFRVLELSPGGKPVVTEEQGHVAPQWDGGLRWIDLCGPDEAKLRVLEERFHFHHLALEDCLHFDQRPKLEEYGEVLFIVIHAITCPDPHRAELQIHEVHAFVNQHYLVTVHDQPVPALDAIWARCAGDGELMKRGIDFIYYLLAEAMSDMNFPLLDRLADEIEDIEDAVLSRPKRSHLQRIFRLKRALVTMRKVLSPQRDVFGLLARRGVGAADERSALYFRDVYDHLVRITESIEASRDLLGNALDAYLSAVSNHTNEIMKRLTIISSVFMPLTFVTGFFGQNFKHLPFDSDTALYAMFAACVVLPAGMLYWFYRSRWL